MDKAKEGFSLFKELYALVGIGIVVPLIMGVIIYMLIKHVGARLQTEIENDIRLGALQENQVKILEKMAEQIDEMKKVMLTQYEKIIYVLARLDARNPAPQTEGNRVESGD